MRSKNLISMIAVSGSIVTGAYFYLDSRQQTISIPHPLVSESFPTPANPISEPIDSRGDVEAIEYSSRKSEEDSTISSKYVQQETKRDYLRRYYGARSSDIEKQLEALGEDLDALVTPNTIMPWEQVEGKVRDILVKSLDEMVMVSNGWAHLPKEVNREYILNNFKIDSRKLSDVDVAMVESIVWKYDTFLQRDISTLQRGVRDALEKIWVDGAYNREPFSPLDISLDRDASLAGTSIGAYGWYVTAAVPRNQFPELSELQKIIDARFSERYAAIQKYLSSL